MIDKKNKDNKYYIFLIVACFMLYLMSISLKTVYIAEQVSVMSVFGTSKADAGLGITFYYILYSLAQIYLATLGKRINIGRFTIITTVMSSASFIMLMFVNAVWQVWLILALNGILQASVWGGCMYFLGKYLPDSWSSAASTIMSFGFVVGTAVSYGGAALFVAILDWRYTFLFFSALMLVSLVLFVAAVRLIKKQVGEKQTKQAIAEEEHHHGMLEEMSKKSVNHFFIYLLFAGFLVCCFYYGIVNWVPNLLKEVFGVDESYSILITILMPVGMMFGPVEANRLCNKTGKVFAVSLLFIGIGTVLVTAMIFVYALNIVLSIIMTMVALFFLRGIVNLLVSYVPLKMKHVMDPGKSSMLINALMCFGAALMPFFTGWYMDNFGWQKYYILMLVIGIATAASLVVGVVKQGKRDLF